MSVLNGSEYALNNVQTLDIIPFSGESVFPVIRSKPNMAIRSTKYNAKEDLDDKSVNELRVIARKLKHKGAWLVAAHQDELIEAILTGQRPMRRAPTAQSPVTPEMQTSLVIFAQEFAKLVVSEVRAQMRGDAP